MLGLLKKIIPSRHGPDAQWIAEASQVYPNTPDLTWLSRRPFHLLFVYGSQMRGHPQHELVIEHGAYSATAYTDGKFSMWKKRLGKASFPIALEGSGWRRPDWDVPKHARVQGELYALKWEQLLELDKHFQNTLEFERKRIPLLIPYHKLYSIPGTPLQLQIEESLGMPHKNSVVTTEKQVENVRAWVYIGKPEFWDDQLEHYFAPVDVFRSRVGWINDYYAFTKEEYVR